MAIFGQVLALSLAGLLILVNVTSVLGQFSPEWDKVLQKRRQDEKGRQEFQKFLADWGEDFKDGVALYNDKERLLQAIDGKLSEMSANGKMSIQDIAPGTQSYALSVDIENRNVSQILISTDCLDHVRMLLRDRIRGEYYALRMKASEGQIPRDGEYVGLGKDPGNMWLCESTKPNKTSNYPPFSGRYCYADIPYSGIGRGECWPSTCNQNDATEISMFVWLVVLKIPLVYYHDCHEPKPWYTADIGFTAALAFFGMLVIAGTFYDVFMQDTVLDRMRRRGKVTKVTAKANALSGAQEVTLNAYENPSAVVDEEKGPVVGDDDDIATSSADDDRSLHSASEIVEEKVCLDAEGDYESIGEMKAKVTVDGKERAGPSPPPSYTSFEDKEGAQMSRDEEVKGHLGWALLHAFLMSFSAVANCRKILSAKKTKNTLTVLNGLRVLSMWWVILGHSVLFYLYRILNPYQSLTWYTEKYGSLAVTNATYSVDTFFVLSGFLVAYFALKQMDSGKLKSAGSWFLFYFHRWWRLTPVYMAAMGIWALIFPHFGQDGFLTDGHYDFIRHYCRVQWWTHPLYINNLFPWPNVVDNSCMGWSWYLANDMQFYIISPIFLFALHRNWKAGTALVSSTMLVSLGSLFGISWYYGYTMDGSEPYNDHVPDPANADTTYAKPYTRIPTYLVGLALGYIMFKLQGRKIKLHWSVISSGWMIALTILWIVVYGPWYATNSTPQAVAVLYLTFSRLAWGVAICWVIFACLHGYGGIDGMHTMQAMLDNKNVDTDRVTSFVTETKDIQETLHQKLREVVSGRSESVTGHVSPTGEHYYSIKLHTQRDESHYGDGGRVLVYEQCMEDVLQYYEDLSNNVYYAGRMDASRGRPKFRDIIYTGSVKDWGNYWLCTSTKENKTSGVPSFNGKYCLADPNEPYGLVTWGTCWPDTCTQDDVNAVGAFFWSEVLGIEPFVYYDCVEKYEWRTPEIGFLACLSFFALMVLCGSFYEVYLQDYVLGKMRGTNKRGPPPSVQLKAADNAYENKAMTDDQGSDIATSSADGGSVAEEAVEQVGEGVIDDEKKGGASFDNDRMTVDETGIVKPPKYQEIDLSDHVTEEPEAKKSMGSTGKQTSGNLGWALLHATLMSFSAVTNCKKLLSAKKTKNTLAVLNGLRVFSMWWVILGHTCSFSLGRYANPAQSLSILGTLSFTAIANATPSVDTFFVLSGFLVTYFALKQMESGNLKGLGGWAMFYFHRWWRLTPVYMAAMGIYTMLMPHLGPFIWFDQVFEAIQGYCQASWWTHPLYINNLYPWPNVIDYSCMGVAWYLAVDMQFYIISPLVFVTLYKNRKAGIFVTTSLMLISLGSLCGISWYYGYPLNNQEPYNDNKPDPPNADVAYAKPYTRLPTYLVGMILGYIMFTLKGKKVKMPWMMVIVGWLVTFTTMWWVIYGVWFTYDKTDVPQYVAVMYYTLHRLGWGISICWIIFACLQGYGGPIAVFLEWKFWVPLARLSYGAYLIHSVILSVKLATDQIPFHFTYTSLSYLFVGNMVFSYAAALILSLLVEGPFMGLEKVILGKFKRS